MKNSLIIVPLALVLAACATAAPTPSPEPASSGVAAAPQVQLAQANPDAAQAAPVEAPAEVEAELLPPPDDETLPRQELTEELLFRILAAEFAFQRGEWQSAYVEMLALAQQTRDPRLARRAAEVAHVARQLPEVLNAVRLWRELAPQSAEANQYFLGLIVAGDDLDEARPVLEQRLKDASPRARAALAFQFQRLLSRARDNKAGFALLEQILKPYDDIPEVRLALAQGATEIGDLDRARREAQAALAASPDSALAILTLAQATPDKNEGAALLAEFLERNPDAREVRMARARLLAEQEKYRESRAEFESMLASNPNDLTVLYALGVLNVQADDLDAAEKYLTTYLEVLERHPDQGRDPNPALLLLAQIAEQRKDIEGLLAWLSRIDSGEAYVHAQIKRAQVIAGRGELDKALELLNTINPRGEREDALLLMAEGQLLREAGQLDDAMRVYEEGLKRLPDNTELLYDYAMLAEKNGAYDVMETSLRRVIELAPEHQHAYNALGYSLAERGIRLEEAHALIRRALSLAPEDAFIIDSMGWVEYRLGRLDEAERHLRRAYSLRQDAEIAAHLGEVLWVKGQRDEARRLWREAQNLDPDNDTLKSTLARLNAAP